MDWCENSFQEANHNPIAVLTHQENLTVISGDSFTLNAFPSTDPDGDNLSFLWFNYPEAGTLKKPIQVNGAENIYKASFTAPKVDEEQTAHFILQLTDKGSPPLSSYKRVIVTIKPN